MSTNPLEKYYFQPEPQVICNRSVPAITEDYCEHFPPLVDRFFTRYYFVKNTGDTFTPYQVLFHSNRICLIGLAAEHPALKEGIQSINFSIGHIDRSKNCVKGKAKKGGMILQADTTLALVTTTCGTVFKVPSCIRSKLIEVNSNLQADPEKLLTANEGEGYIAIVLPKPEHCNEIKATLMTEDKYKKYLEEMPTLNGPSVKVEH